MALADAVKRAAAKVGAAPKVDDIKIDPFEIAAEEFASAKTPGERADALRAITELASLRK